ncbi:hypothetical protein B0H13DRAFT_1850054 [Mycena leptocephala]|nr:hypothetical protein B0H13DRAFT_1850054 [Mycena leptocephala]
MASLPDLQYPPSANEVEDQPIPEDKRPLDLTVPVSLIAWDDDDVEPVKILAYPRVDETSASSFWLGEIVLKDYRAAFLAAGLDLQSHVQRYLEPMRNWIAVPWSTYTVPVFGLNRGCLSPKPWPQHRPPSEHIVELFQKK